ncbi:MAG: hypothetical protein SGCHY_002700 [Lobulomycetales sp.]
MSEVPREAFVFTLENRYEVGKQPQRTTLLDTVDSGAFGGVKGKHFQSSSACRAYTCPTAANATECTMLDAPQCADVEGVEGVDYHLAYTYFRIRGQSLDFERDWEADGYPNGLITMLWKGAPVYGSRLKLPEDGVFASDIDFSTYSPSQPDDAFAELQAYHSLTLAHRFFVETLDIASILGPNDPNFCLIGTGPDCTQTDPRTNRTPTALNYPHRFVVNYPQIQFSPSSASEFQDPLTQIDQGRGKSVDDPVSFDEWKEYGVQIFGYGHGAENGDWALNDCINYHEVGHALVAKLLPNFSSFILTSDGVKSDPGAMNEGWADYFASALCGVADYRVGTYHGRPNRSLKNELTCVDLVGEVHADGSVFAGGLWAVRESMPENLRTDFDKLILRALSLSGNDEQFSDQYNRILELLENSLNSTNAGLSNYTQLAREEFGKRVLGCTPVGTYTDSDTPTFFLPSARIVNDARDSERGPQISTVPAKVLIKARPADWAFSIKWNQLSSTVFGPSNLGYGKAPLRTFLSTGCEFKLQVSNASAPALDPDCPTARNIEMGVGRFEYTFAAEESHDVYMLFSHEHPSSISMQSAYFEFSGPQAMTRYVILILACINVLISLFLFASRLVRRIKRRKRSSAGRRSRLISRAWNHAKGSPVTHRILSTNGVLAMVTGSGAAALVIIGIILPWYIRLLSQFALVVMVIMTSADILSFGLLSNSVKRDPTSTSFKATLGSYGVSSAGLLSLLVVAIQCERNVYTAAVIDYIVFIGILVLGLCRLTSFLALWRWAFSDRKEVEGIKPEQETAIAFPVAPAETAPVDGSGEVWVEQRRASRIDIDETGHPHVTENEMLAQRRASRIDIDEPPPQQQRHILPAQNLGAGEGACKEEVGEREMVDFSTFGFNPKI